MDDTATPEAQATSKRPRVRIGAVVAIAIAAGVVVWLLVGRGGDDNNAASSTTTPTQQAAGVGPTAMSTGDLKSLADKLGHPIYWAGAKGGFTYEVTETADGKVYVRYLPKGVAVGDSGAKYLIVATYPYPKALAALKRVAGKKATKLSTGAYAFVDPTYPKSVHVAYPHSDYQIEVFDPSPARAKAVAFSGDVAPVS